LRWWGWALKGLRWAETGRKYDEVPQDVGSTIPENATFFCSKGVVQKVIVNAILRLLQKKAEAFS